MEIQLNGEPFVPNGRNMALYHYSGELACFTHIFMETERDEANARIFGGFVWCDDPGFMRLHEFIVEEEYPMYLNQKDVRPSDEAAWHEKHVYDLDETDGLPEGWDGNAA